jgi:tetratricopeptide (TPR) repeat protein
MDEGRELVYTNQSSGGMSGGGVFDTEGRLGGVNTASEVDTLGGQEIDVGYSLGIPITTFLGIAEAAQFSTLSFPKIANPAVEVNDSEIQQIKAQLFRFQLPQLGSTVVDWLNYGNSLWRAGEYTESIKAFDQAISLLGKEGSQSILAQAYYAKGLALTDLGQSLIPSNNQKALGKHEEALTAFQQATKTFFNFSNAWYWEGNTLAALQRYPEALIAYEQAIDKNQKDDFVPYIGRGNMLSELKRYSEALASYNQAIILKPNHPWIYNNRGMLYVEIGKIDLAITDFTKATQLNPQYTQAYGNRGTAYNNIGQKEFALQDYNKVIEIDPQDFLAYFNRGFIFYEIGQKELAFQDYNQSIKINSNYDQSYVNRGVLYAETNRKNLALQDYNKAIELNPKNAQVYNNRGNVYKDLNQNQLAINDYSKAININPKYAKAYLNRGLLYQKTNSFQMAKQDFQNAAKFFYEEGNIVLYQYMVDMIKSIEFLN